MVLISFIGYCKVNFLVNAGARKFQNFINFYCEGFIIMLNVLSAIVKDVPFSATKK